MPTCYRHPDRETGLSCSECGRPICTECMTMAPVGIRCPDHAGNAGRKKRLRGPAPVIRAQRQLGSTFAPVTKALIVINLAFSFTFAGISWGGHVGGLIGGILATLAFARWGRGHAAYGRLGLGGALGLVFIAAASVALAYWKVRGLA